eukprot:2807991-Ditylum_brightwellii.AAC.1
MGQPFAMELYELESLLQFMPTLNCCLPQSIYCLQQHQYVQWLLTVSKLAIERHVFHIHECCGSIGHDDQHQHNLNHHVINNGCWQVMGIIVSSINLFESSGIQSCPFVPICLGFHGPS